VLGVAVHHHDGAAPTTSPAARLQEAGAAARCAQALQALGGGAAARAALAELTAGAVPAGLERVHPGWLRRALEGERSTVVRALAAALPAALGALSVEILEARGEDPRAPAPQVAAPVVSALARALFGALAPLPPEASAAARALCALPFAALLEEIDRRGARTLGTSLAGAPARVLAQAAAGAGEVLGSLVLEAARAAVTPQARAAARELVAAAAGGAARAVGLRALAGELARQGAGPEAVAAVAQRLPPAVGDALVALAEAA